MTRVWIYHTRHKTISNMKKPILWIAISIMSCLAIPLATRADEPFSNTENTAGNDAPIDPGDGPIDPNDAPIDGGLVLLLAAGAAYGVKKYRHRGQVQEIAFG